MPFKRCGYKVAEADVIKWANTKMNVPVSDSVQVWRYLPAVEEAFDAHPKDFKETFSEIFPLGMFTVLGNPSSPDPEQRKAMYFFVRAAGDSENGTPEYREWLWTEKEIDRKIKKFLEDVLELKLSDWFEKYY